MVTLSKLRNLKAKYQHGLATLAKTERTVEMYAYSWTWARLRAIQLNGQGWIV